MWLFGKKSSSMKSKNEKKTDILKEIDGLLTHIERGKYSKDIGNDCVGKVREQLIKRREKLECATFTRNEDIDYVVKEIQKSVAELYNALDSGIGTEKAVNKLTGYLDALSDGRSEAITRDDLREVSSRQSYSQSELSDKISEMESIRARVFARKEKINRDKEDLQREKEELEDRLVDEEDADRINDLDRRISGIEGRIGILSASYSANSACMSNFDQVIEYAKIACGVGGAQAERANALLNMEKIRTAESNPGSLEIIMQQITAENEQLRGKTERSDESRSRRTVGNAAVPNEQAQRRKEELLNNRRQKEVNDENMKPINRALAPINRELEKEMTKNGR